MKWTRWYLGSKIMISVSQMPGWPREYDIGHSQSETFWFWWVAFRTWEIRVWIKRRWA